MKLAALVYAGSLSRYALQPLGGESSAYDRSLAFAAALPGLENILVAEGAVALPQGPQKRLRRELWTVDSILEALAEAGEGMDAVAFLWADQPFLDPDLAERMLESYHRYRAEYCFADGYPIGLAMEILAPRIIPALRSLCASLPPEPARDSLFSVVQKDINSFDIETAISPLDLRDLRLTLACDSKRDSLLVERLMEVGVRDERSALRIIPERLDLLRTLPAFVQVQIAGGCPQVCELCPYPRFGGEILERGDFLEKSRFLSLLDQIEALSGDAVIDLSLWGEPSRHPDIGSFIDEVLARPGFSLIVETSGIGWNRDLVAALAVRHPERLNWIVSLDAWSPELYSTLRGPGYVEAVSFAEFLIGLFPRGAYVQCVRARENEVELEAFWRGWKKKTENVIVQKYSAFVGLLPERRVSDLSPLVRRPCWHLKRDLVIGMDGTVPLCRECVRGEIVVGNAFSEGGLREAWEAGEAFHAAHVEACLRPGSSYPQPCAVCDEYYTYNA
ncbi:MAG: spiro-SPASM protein [Rectinemataceae bacterium]